jgi:hypothetical protein
MQRTSWRVRAFAPSLAAGRKPSQIQALSEESRLTHVLPMPLPSKGLDLEPIPRLELAWAGGPEPDPPFASVPSSPAALSRAASRGPSRPSSALPSSALPSSVLPSSALPSSALQRRASAQRQPQSAQPEAYEPPAASPREAPSVPSKQRPASGSRPWSGAPTAASQPRSVVRDAAGGGPAWSGMDSPVASPARQASSRPVSAAVSSPSPGASPRRGGYNAVAGPTSATPTPRAAPPAGGGEPWEEARSMGEASGTPRMW